MIEKNILTMKVFEAVEKSEVCPLCYLWTKNEERYVKHVLTSEVVMNPEFRENVVAAFGFCNRHAHMLYEAIHERDVDDGLGYALYMNDVFERVEEQLSSLYKSLHNISESLKDRKRYRKKTSIISLNDLMKRLIGHKTQKRECPICEHLKSMDQIYSYTLIQMLDDEDFRKDFNSSKGLCLPHFITAMQIITVIKLKNPIHIAQTLLDNETKHFQLIQNLLSEFIRKQSWEFRNEPHGPEVNANILSLNYLVGAKGYILDDNPRMKKY
ncbi:MAG: DUF6062 family protein [Nitrososphaerota archaeon]